MSASREIISALIAGGMDAADAAALMAQAVVEMTAQSYPKSAGATRQARYRERHKASQSVTPLRSGEASQSVTERNESVTRDALPLSIEENIEKKKEKKGKAHRLPDDWQPRPQDWATACLLLGSDNAAREQIETFRDHWKAAPDKDAKKDDWDATWRNWVRRSKSWGNRNANRTANQGSPQRTEFFAAAARRAERYAGEDSMARPADPMGPSPGEGIDRSGAPGFAGPMPSSGDGAGGIEPDPERTIEGEASAGDEAGGGISDGPDFGFRRRRTA